MAATNVAPCLHNHVHPMAMWGGLNPPLLRGGIAQEVVFSSLEATCQAPKMLCSPRQASQECPITWSAWISLFLFKLLSQLMDHEQLSPKWKGRANGGRRVKELSSHQPRAVNRRAGIYLPGKQGQRWGQLWRQHKCRDRRLQCHKIHITLETDTWWWLLQYIVSVAELVKREWIKINYYPFSTYEFRPNL